MYKSFVLCLITLVLSATTAAFADDSGPKPESKTARLQAKRSEKPAASPGWIVIEEDWWVPFQSSPIESMDNTRMHFRRGEEKAAAKRA